MQALTAFLLKRDCIMGKAYAAVFPEPVFALASQISHVLRGQGDYAPSMSLPSNASGIAAT
jgi:hypothetical protein